MTQARGHTAFHLATITAAALAAVIGGLPDEAFGRPSGGRGAATSVHRGGGGGGAAHRPPPSRPNAGGNRGGTVNRGGDRTTVNRGGNVNVNNNRNTNINVDVDRGWDHDGWDHHPVANGVAFGAAAAVTSAVVGSMVYSLPPSCRTVVRAGISYSQCGDVWYEPQYSGSSVTYVVVNQPY